MGVQYGANRGPAQQRTRAIWVRDPSGPVLVIQRQIALLS